MQNVSLTLQHIHTHQHISLNNPTDETNRDYSIKKSSFVIVTKLEDLGSWLNIWLIVNSTFMLQTKQARAA